MLIDRIHSCTTTKRRRLDSGKTVGKISTRSTTLVGLYRECGTDGLPEDNICMTVGEMNHMEKDAANCTVVVTATGDNETVRSRPVRVYMDGCFDLLHYGHANALRKAKQLGDHLVAGLHSDATIADNKAPPVFTEEERCQLISAIKWVDEVVKDAPFKLTPEFLQKHDCDFCVHGDDVSVDTEGMFSYQIISDAGMYRVVPRTRGVSTTDLVGRMLLATRTHHELEEEKIMVDTSLQNIAQDKAARRPATAISQFFPSTKRIAEFSSGRDPTPGDRVIYVSGAFDLFHVGHLKFLQKCVEEGDYLLVGIHTDPVANRYKGENYPIMNLHERVLSVLSIKYVDEVLIGAPYNVTEDLMNHYNIHMVVHGCTPIKTNPDGTDPFVIPKRMGRFKVVDSGCKLKSEDILDRIIKNRLLYEERNRKKEKKESDYVEEQSALATDQTN